MPNGMYGGVRGGLNFTYSICENYKLCFLNISEKYTEEIQK